MPRKYALQPLAALSRANNSIFRVGGGFMSPFVFTALALGCRSPLLVLFDRADGIVEPPGAGMPLRSSVDLLLGVAVAMPDSSLSAAFFLSSDTLALGRCL